MLSWLFFENDFHACQANIRQRASRSIEDNLRALHEYRALYQIPIGAQVIRSGNPVHDNVFYRVRSQAHTYTLMVSNSLINERAGFHRTHCSHGLVQLFILVPGGGSNPHEVALGGF